MKFEKLPNVTEVTNVHMLTIFSSEIIVQKVAVLIDRSHFCICVECFLEMFWSNEIFKL